MATDMEDDTITFYARQQIWQQYAGAYYQRKCLYPWCNRIMNQNNFCVIFYDHTPMWNITSIQNMRPVCDVCYSSMRRPTMREWVDHMDYIHSMEVHVSESSHGDASAPLSHGEGMNSQSSDGYVLPSHPSFSHPRDHMES
jgi:hypothetical protein